VAEPGVAATETVVAAVPENVESSEPKVERSVAEAASPPADAAPADEPASADATPPA